MLLQNQVIQLLKIWPLILLVIVVVHFGLTRYRKGLAKIPGPLLRSISSIPRLWSVARGKSQNDDLKLHQRYGSIVRLAPNTLSISDAEEMNQIYGIKTEFLKSDFYDLSSTYDEEGLVPDPFVLKDKVAHARMKRNSNNAYSLNGLIQLEPCIEPVTVRFLRLLDEQYAQTGKPCDLSHLINYYAMDAVCALTFGKDLSFMEQGDQKGFLKLLKFFSVYMAIGGQIPWVHKYLLGSPTFAAWYFANDTSNDQLLAVTEGQMLEAKQMPEEEQRHSRTFLQQLFDNQKKNPESLTDREIKTHATGNIAAGSDTTAIAIRSAIYYLLKYPQTYNRLAKEVREGLSLPVSYRKASELPYLKAVIREAMRIHPSVGMILSRVVPPGGAVICGHKIAEGVEVGINPWIIHRDPSVFPEPDKFIPERWLTSDEDHLKRMNRSFFAFGGGTHTCSGRNISLLETTKFIPSLLLSFELELVEDGGTRFKTDNLWFTFQSGLIVRLKSLREKTQMESQ